MYNFILPDCVYLPRKTKKDKKIMLNDNVYRNLHYQVKAEMKRIFEPVSVELFKADRIEVSYIVEKKSKRRFDSMNVVSRVDKFFLDWLVNNGFIPDDTNLNVSYGNITGIGGCEENRVLANIKIIERG